MGERSKSFSPECAIKKPPGMRNSISQVHKGSRQSMDKAACARKFLSLKTLRIHGLPAYALNHAKAFEWLGKYGLIERVIVIDKSEMGTTLDVEFRTTEAARLCILDAHGSVIRTASSATSALKVRVSPCVVQFCHHYLHGMACHNAKCTDLHSCEAFDWIRSLPAGITAKQITDIKHDIVREIRARWRSSKRKPKLLGESEDTCLAKITQHDFASEILTLSVVLAELYANQPH